MILLSFLSSNYDKTTAGSVYLYKKYNFGLCHMFQEFEESPPLFFGSSTPRGVILPHSSEEVPVSLLAKAVGKRHHSLRIAVFGSLQPPLVSCSAHVCF